ncbi:MAG TPA: Crp/Fnr family transcriptional regulator [Acidimicrobiales bacterium]|nr:Crp/Fnr family transcriptional regulator [Acidimicrobiales bacterium]
MEWPILAELPTSERLAVLNLCSRRHVAQGEFVCRLGERGDRLFLLEVGHALVETMTSEGDISTFAVLGPGDVFGEQSLISGMDRRTASVVSIEPLDLLYMTRREFEELSVAHPAVSRFLLTIMAARLQDVTSQLLEALYGSAEQRVLSSLLRLAHAYAAPRAGSVRIPLHQEQIASLAGTTRPTANRVLRDATRAGAIALGRGYLVVVDSEVLVRLYSEAGPRR